MLEQSTTHPKKEASVTSPFPHSFKCQDNFAHDCELNMDHNMCSPTGSSADVVSIVMDGEKYLVSGVDANTTCMDLISALLYSRDFEEKNEIVDNDNLPTSHTFHKLSKEKNVPFQNSNHIPTISNTKENGVTAYGKSPNNLYKYAIVKRLRDSRLEEYLDGGTRVLDIIPAGDNLTKSLWELQLRNLTGAKTDPSPSRIHNHMLSMLSMSTDKDSGMGSPIDSSHSDRYRRRRRKRRSGLGCTLANQDRQLQSGNEQLIKIIMAQDETINRQIYMLNQKEKQILKIEEQKHRARELRLGKNYMLETYLKALDKTSDKSLDNQNARDKKQDAMTWATMGNTSPVFLCTDYSNEMDIYWLEKIYELNFRLQREEEQLLRLHAKVRKHQMRYAYHTKDEVLQQIDQLDTNLAIQMDDIYRVERQLLVANEQLKAKLGVLETLGNELLVTPPEDQECEPNLGDFTTDLNRQIATHASANNHLMARYFKQYLREVNIKNDDPAVKSCAKTQLRKLNKSNVNVNDPIEAKMMKEQMFFAVDRADFILTTLATSSPSCRPNGKEDFHHVSRCKSNINGNTILAPVETEFDIHFGTLV